MPARFYEPIFVPSRASSYATTHDYGIDDSINRADYLSNAVLEDTYEAATRSRGKDHALLRNLNAAIVSTELHVNPRVAAVSRRVRASTLPPAPRPPPGLHFQQPQAPQYIQEGVYYRTPATSALYASRPPLAGSSYGRASASSFRLSAYSPRPVPRSSSVQPLFQPLSLPALGLSADLPSLKSRPLPPVKIQPPKPSPFVPSTPSTRRC